MSSQSSIQGLDVDFSELIIPDDITNDNSNLSTQENTSQNNSTKKKEENVGLNLYN